MAIKYKSICYLLSVDDKAIVPIGEPDKPVSTGVRIHHGSLVTTSQFLGALDHDFHIFGAVPSVTLNIDIPDNINDSFYKGQVYVGLKDKVFQPSDAYRHAVELIQNMRSRYSSNGDHSDRPILMVYSDGGPDHRTNYVSVKIASVVVFVALDLYMYVACRTAPCQSFRNPAERVMSTLNLALQNVSLQREAVPDESVEQRIGNLSTLKKLRAAAAKNDAFKHAVQQTTQNVLKKLECRFERLTYTGHNIIVSQPADSNDINNICVQML